MRPSCCAGPTLDPDDNFYRRDLSQELRLTSDFAGPLHFTTGAFIQDGKRFSNVTVRGNEALGLPAIIPGAWGTHAINIDSQSLFGQLLWKIIPRVELSAGARWTHEDRTDNVTDDANGARIPLADPRIDSCHINPEVSLTYRPTDALTLYGSFKTASKSGSFSADQIPAAGDDIAFGDETVKGGEVSIKGLLFSRRLRFNVDAYHYGYDNLQVGVDVVSPEGLVDNITLNAASATVQGIELNATYQVPYVEDLFVPGSTGLNQAQFSRFIDAPCAGGQTVAQGCNQGFDTKTGLYTSQNLTGRPLVRAPNFTASVGLDYIVPVMDRWSLEASSDSNFSSNDYTDLILRSDTIQSAFFKTNLALTLTSPDRRWDLAFIGNNLNNVLITGNCVNAPFRNGVLFPGVLFAAGRSPAAPPAAGAVRTGWIA